jgi:hypothetical protein
MDSTLDRRIRGAGVEGCSPPVIASPKSRGADDEAPAAKDTTDSARSRPKKSRAPFEPERMDSPLDRRGGLGVLGRGGSSVFVVVVDDDDDDDGRSSADA